MAKQDEGRHPLKISAERLRALRERRFWSQEELAERARVSRATIYKAEGGAGVAPKTGRALAEAFGIPPEELVEELVVPKAPAPSPDTASVAALPDVEERIDYRKLYFERRQEHIDLIREILDEAGEVMGTEDYEEFIKLPSEEQHRRIDYAERLTNLAHENLKHFDEDDLPEEIEHKVIHLRTTVEEFKKISVRERKEGSRADQS